MRTHQSANIGGMTDQPGLRTKTYSGSTTDEAEAAFHADLAAAAGAGYFPVGQRWDTSKPTPTLAVEYRHQRPAVAGVAPAVETQPATAPPRVEPEKRKAASPVMGCITVLAILIGIMWFVNQQSGFIGNRSAPDRDAPTRQQPTERWYPTGYSPWPNDPTVAYRWLDPDDFDCDLGLRCTGLMVTTRDGCPSWLYVEAQVLNASGVVVGGTNARPWLASSAARRHDSSCRSLRMMGARHGCRTSTASEPRRQAPVGRRCSFRCQGLNHGPAPRRAGPGRTVRRRPGGFDAAHPLLTCNRPGPRFCVVDESEIPRRSIRLSSSGWTASPPREAHPDGFRSVDLGRGSCGGSRSQ